MGTWLWIIPSVVAVFLFFLFRRAMKSRIDLSAYAAYVLLNREIAENHARKLREFIANSRSTGAVQLSGSVCNWVDNCAAWWAKADTGNLHLGMSAAVWRIKKESEPGSGGDST